MGESFEHSSTLSTLLGNKWKLEWQSLDFNNCIKVDLSIQKITFKGV